MTTTTTDPLTSKLAYLTRVLKTPTIGRTWETLADQARADNWSHEEYLATVLERQVADRESAGAMMRIRTAHFPSVKTLEEFNLDHLPSLRRDLLAHLATATLSPKPRTSSCSARPASARPTVKLALGPTGLPGAGMPVSVLVIATDPKRLIDSPLGGVLAMDLSS